MHPKNAGYSLRSLTVQLSLIVITIPTLVLMSFGYFQVKSQALFLEQNLDQDLKIEVAQLSASLSTALFNFDDETCQVICKAALNKPEIMKIAIYEAGSVYQSFTAKGFTGKENTQGIKEVGGAIFFKAEEIGAVKIWATTRLMEENLKAVKASMFWQILILDLVLGLVMGLVLILKFVKPLRALENTSDKIASGDLEHPIDVSRKDELGSLAANLLIMRDAVREKVASLQSEIRRHEKTTTDLKKTKAYVDNIFNAMSSILIAVDQDLRITQCNHRAAEITGVAADQAIGRPLERLAADLEPLKDDIRATMETGNLFSRPRSTRFVDGRTVYEDIAVYPLVSEYGRGAVIRIDDVTEHVKMEQMLVQSEKMLSVGGLAAGMAHEINNPLAGMMQNAQVVLNRIHGDVPASIDAAKKVGVSLNQIQEFMDKRGITRQLESIRSAGVRASQIVQNMLSFSRKEAAGKSRRDIGKILDQSLELARSDYDLKKQYDFKNFEITRDFQADGCEAVCEASKIQQVFFNIFKNCAQAMQDRTPEQAQEPPRLELKVYASATHVTVEIADNGPGMTEAVRKRVFEPFFTTKAVGAGTGLGLSVSYFIITDNHGGEMRVVSSPGKGARFIIQLPIQ